MGGADPEPPDAKDATTVPSGKSTLESLDEPALPTTEATEEEGEYTLQEWVDEEDELIRVRRLCRVNSKDKGRRVFWNRKLPRRYRESLMSVLLTKVRGFRGCWVAS